MYETRYIRAQSLDEARAQFAAHEDAAYLSGGHTLLPTMKNRLAAPRALIDVRAIPELRGIEIGTDALAIGAATQHAEVAASDAVQRAIPALAGLAGSIGDVQVRHMGTIGGSLANNDPAADYPAAALGLGATIQTDRREIVADAFFKGLFETALAPGEIILRIAFAAPAAAGYAKLRNPASRYAIAASFVARAPDGAVRVAVTGAGQDGVFRWRAAEERLTESFAPEAIKTLSPDPRTMLSDTHASAPYRAHLVSSLTARAAAGLGETQVF